MGSGIVHPPNNSRMMMHRSSSTVFLLALLVALFSSAHAFVVKQPSCVAPSVYQDVTTVSSPTALHVNIKVSLGDGEPVESALRRFKREVSKSGHLMELRHKRYFENSQQKKKRKIKEGRLRRKFERLQRRRMMQRRNNA